MKKISNKAELKASIAELELKTKRQEELLKINAKSTAKTFRPVNLLRIGVNTFKRASTTPDIRTTALNTFVGLTAGFLTRKIVVGKSRNIFKKTLGAAVQAGITRLIYKNLNSPAFKQKTAKLISNVKRG